eukprot:2552050-Pleurochrysis_carterae.AAC.1
MANFAAMLHVDSVTTTCIAKLKNGIELQGMFGQTRPSGEGAVESEWRSEWGGEGAKLDCLLALR